MSRASKGEYLGALTIDLTPIKTDLVDLPPGGTHGLKREKEGAAEMLAELQAAKAQSISKAGITQDTITRIEDITAKLKDIRKAKAEAEKMAEVLKETEAYWEDLREADITLIAKAIQTTAKHTDPGLNATFQSTLHYYSQVGDKAAATRKKNEKKTE